MLIQVPDSLKLKRHQILSIEITLENKIVRENAE